MNQPMTTTARQAVLGQMKTVINILTGIGSRPEPAEKKRGPGRVVYLGRGSGLARLASSYSSIQDAYWDEVRTQVFNYLFTGTQITPYKAAMKRAMTTAFSDTFEAAYLEGGGEEIDPEDAAWLKERTAAEKGYIDSLFGGLKDWRKERLTAIDGIGADEAAEKATSVADGYVDGLDSVFSEGRLRGAKNVMLTLDGPAGEKPCATCKKLNNTRRSAKWWVKQGLIPGAGNSNYDCNGYNCQHTLRDDKYNRWTL